MAGSGLFWRVFRFGMKRCGLARLLVGGVSTGSDRVRRGLACLLAWTGLVRQGSSLGLVWNDMVRHAFWWELFQPDLVCLSVRNSADWMVFGPDVIRNGSSLGSTSSRATGFWDQFTFKRPFSFWLTPWRNFVHATRPPEVSVQLFKAEQVVLPVTLRSRGSDPVFLSELQHILEVALADVRVLASAR